MHEARILFGLEVFWCQTHFGDPMTFSQIIVVVDVPWSDVCVRASYDPTP
jgi:hypothetical protein